MSYRKLNEKLSKLINEVSDTTKQSLLRKRQAQVNKAQKSLERAKGAVAKSDQRQISNLPQKTTLENAENALNALKSEMRKISKGSDWRLEESEDGKYLNLEVRYWGQWNDREEDDDWAPLDDKYKQILDDILVKVQKQYEVQITNQGSEKKWLSFAVQLDDINKILLVQAENIKRILEDYYPIIDFVIEYDEGGYWVGTDNADDQAICISPDDDNIAYGVLDNLEGTQPFYKVISIQSLTDEATVSKIYDECIEVYKKGLALAPLDFAAWTNYDMDSLVCDNLYWSIYIFAVEENANRVTVGIRSSILNDELFEWEDLDHIPSIEELEKIAKRIYPNIVYCHIHEIPNELKQNFIKRNNLELKEQ